MRIDSGAWYSYDPPGDAEQYPRWEQPLPNGDMRINFFQDGGWKIVGLTKDYEKLPQRVEKFQRGDRVFSTTNPEYHGVVVELVEKPHETFGQMYHVQWDRDGVGAGAIFIAYDDWIEFEDPARSAEWIELSPDERRYLRQSLGINPEVPL